MLRTLKSVMRQDREKFKIPRSVQQAIPIQRIWKDGIFQVGSKFSKSYQFSDINYRVASREDKESMFLTYSELLEPKQLKCEPQNLYYELLKGGKGC